MFGLRAMIVLVAAVIGVVGDVERHAGAQDGGGSGVLDKLRQDVRGGTAASPRSDRGPRRNQDDVDPWGYAWCAYCREYGRDGCPYHFDEEDDENRFWEAVPLLPELGEQIALGVTAPFWGPRALLDDWGLPDGRFLAYPYEYGIGGYLLESRSELFPRARSSWGFRLQGEYGEDFDAIRRAGMRVLIETSSRFGVDAAAGYYREWLGVGLRDELWIGDVNLVYRFAQSDRLLLRSGGGLNYLTDAGSTDLGFNFTYGGDWFPRRPWIISADLDVGTLGKANLFHGRVTIGVGLRGIEFYSGYDYLDVGSTRIGTVIGGIRLWH